MIRDVNAGIARVLTSDRIRRQHVRIIAGMIDAVPGATCFRIYFDDGTKFNYEVSTIALAVQPQLII